MVNQDNCVTEKKGKVLNPFLTKSCMYCIFPNIPSVKYNQEWKNSIWIFIEHFYE
jgi:hypothetical protein